jgi:hypothetical protein
MVQIYQDVQCAACSMSTAISPGGFFPGDPAYQVVAALLILQ